MLPKFLSLASIISICSLSISVYFLYSRGTGCRPVEVRALHNLRGRFRLGWEATECSDSQGRGCFTQSSRDCLWGRRGTGRLLTRASLSGLPGGPFVELPTDTWCRNGSPAGGLTRFLGSPRGTLLTARASWDQSQLTEGGRFPSWTPCRTSEWSGSSGEILTDYHLVSIVYYP